MDSAQNKNIKILKQMLTTTNNNRKNNNNKQSCKFHLCRSLNELKANNNTKYVFSTSSLYGVILI